MGVGTVPTMATLRCILKTSQGRAFNVNELIP